MRDVFLFVSANHTKTEKPNTRHLYPTFDAQRTLFMSSACYSPQPGSLYAEQSRNITCVRYWIGNVLTQVGVCIGMHVVLAL
jgi:hypothetical protein